MGTKIYYKNKPLDFRINLNDEIHIGELIRIEPLTNPIYESDKFIPTDLLCNEMDLTFRVLGQEITITVNSKDIEFES